MLSLQTRQNWLWNCYKLVEDQFLLFKLAMDNLSAYVTLHISIQTGNWALQVTCI